VLRQCACDEEAEADGSICSNLLTQVSQQRKAVINSRPETKRAANSNSEQWIGQSKGIHQTAKGEGQAAEVQKRVTQSKSKILEQIRENELETE